MGSVVEPLSLLGDVGIVVEEPPSGGGDDPATDEENGELDGDELMIMVPAGVVVVVIVVVMPTLVVVIPMDDCELELEMPVSPNTISGEYGSLTRMADWAKESAPLLTTLMFDLREQGFEPAT